MSGQKLTYRLILVLVLIITSVGTSRGQANLTTPDSLSFDHNQNKSNSTDSIICEDSVQTEQTISESRPTPLVDDTTAVALDTTDMRVLADSLLITDIYTPKKHFMPDPKRALWLSLIVPGAGQIYNRKLWKLPIVYGGFLGCMYALSWNNQMYRDYSQAYLDIMDDDPSTKSYEDMLPLNYSIEGREEQYQEIFKNKKNYYRKYRDMSIFAMIAVYLLSVVDAYVDAELSSFDISKDLSMSVEPTVFFFGRNKADCAAGVQCNISF